MILICTFFIISLLHQNSGMVVRAGVGHRETLGLGPGPATDKVYAMLICQGSPYGGTPPIKADVI